MELEEAELQRFGTPPSSPAQQRKIIKFLVVTSVCENIGSTSKSIRTRVEELKPCKLTPKESFFVSNWNFEFGDHPQIIIRRSRGPEKNTLVLSVQSLEENF